MKYYIIPPLEDQRPDIAVIHIGSNNINYHDLNIDPLKVAESIIELAEKCIEYDVKDIVISSIMVKKGLRLNAKIREVNDALESLCLLKDFHFIRNDDVTTEYLEDGGIHLTESGTNIFAGNIVDYINNCIFCEDLDWQIGDINKVINRSNNHIEFQNSNIFNESIDIDSHDSLNKIKELRGKNII